MELKYGLKATEGKAGIEKHLQDFECTLKGSKDFLEDMSLLIESKKKLKLIDSNCKVDKNLDSPIFDLIIKGTEKDYTTIKNMNMALYKFTLESNSTNDTYKFKMDVRPGGNSVDYKIYSLIDDMSTTISDGKVVVNKGCYPYPFNKSTGKPNLNNTLLFRHIMDNKLESLFDGNGSTRPTQININDTTLNNRNVYYVAIPNDLNNAYENNTTNSNNLLKSVSISKLINVKTLKNFYPLNLKANPDGCNDVLDANGNYTTTITLEGVNQESINNIVGKRFKLRFYANKNDNIILYETSVTATSNKNIVWKPTLNERSQIGIKHNETTNNDDITVLYADYEATIISDNITSPSYYNTIEIPVKFKNNKAS
jgi:hypothetical protein